MKISRLNDDEITLPVLEQLNILSLTENLCLAETKQAWSIWNFYAMAKRWNKLFTDEIILWGPKSLIQTVNSILILTLKSLENRLNKLGNFWP